MDSSECKLLTRPSLSLSLSFLLCTDDPWFLQPSSATSCAEESCLRGENLVRWPTCSAAGKWRRIRGFWMVKGVSPGSGSVSLELQGIRFPSSSPSSSFFSRFSSFFFFNCSPSLEFSSRIILNWRVLVGLFFILENYRILKFQRRFLWSEIKNLINRCVLILKTIVEKKDSRNV